MTIQRRTTVYVDQGGRTSAHLLTTSAGAASVAAAILAVSNAAESAHWEGDYVANIAPAPGGGAYPQVRVRAELIFQTAAGRLQKVYVPAPHSGIFMADGETVDPSTIAALIAAVLADVVTPDGTALTAFVAGTRQG